MNVAPNETDVPSKGPLASAIGTVQIANPVLLASGTAGHGTELSPYLNLGAVGAVVVKSLAVFDWEGNKSPRLYETPSGMINSIGLQGPGIAYWIEEILPNLLATGAKVVLSIWGRTLDDYYAAAEMCASLPGGIVAVEINVSCPNVEDRGQIFAHSPESIHAVLRATDTIDLPRWAKLSPNVTDLVEIATAACEGGADALTLINTLMGMVISTKSATPILGAGGGGLSGPAIRPIAVRSVFDVHSALPDIPIIGVGGIASAQHAIEFMMAGASAIQVGTANFANPKISETIINDLKIWCKDNEITNLKEIVGSAHQDKP